MLYSYLQDSLFMLNSYLQTFVIHILPRTTKIILLRLGISLHNFSKFRASFYKSPAGRCSGQQWDFTDDITILNKRKDISFSCLWLYGLCQCVQANGVITSSYTLWPSPFKPVYKPSCNCGVRSTGTICKV